MTSDRHQLPPGFEFVRVLGKGRIFSTIQAREIQPGNSETTQCVFLVFDSAISNDPNASEKVHQFFERYQGITNYAHLPRVHTVSGGAGTPLFVKEEYVEGTPLPEFIRSFRSLNPAGPLEQVCEALHAAHLKGVHHLCITPDRVLVLEKGQKVKLVGFGTEAVIRQCRTLQGDSKRFVAPEVLRGEPFDARADVFSLGVMILDLFPQFKSYPGIMRAVSPSPDERFAKARLLESQLFRAFTEGKPSSDTGSQSGRGGLVPKPTPGGLVPKITVTTSPIGAQVILDGKPLGMTGVSGLAISWKQGDLVIEKKGFERVCLSYRERPTGNEVHIDLEPQTIPLRIVTQPVGAYVTIDGNEYGSTPGEGLELRVPLGKRSITLSKPGYRNKVSTVDLKEPRSTRIKVKLEPNPLLLITEPAGASVKVGDRFIGITGSQGLPVPWTEGQIVVEKDGYETVTRGFASGPTDVILRIELKASLVPVVIKTIPDGAEIKIDGKFLGRTEPSGLRVGLSPGNRRIVITKTGYEPKDFTEFVQGPGQSFVGPIALVPTVKDPSPSPAPPVQPPKNIPTHMSQSVLVTLFCCLPGGAVAWHHSSKVSSEIAAGNFAAAEEHSKKANRWAWYSAGAALLLIFLSAVSKH